MPNVGSTPVAFQDDSGLIQNLGPGTLYVGNSDTVTVSTGVRVAAGESITNLATTVYAVSDGTSDVRSLYRGSGIFASAASSS